MAWIESHQTLWEHPKTRKAARRLSVHEAQLVGHLHALWHWSLDHAEDGDVSEYDAEDLAIAARWDGDPDEFVQALLSCGGGSQPGFLEHDGPCGDPSEGRTAPLVLRNWWSYAGKLVARRQRDRRRKSEERSNGSPEDVQGTSDGQAKDVQRSAGKNQTEPNPTQPDPTKERFDQLWDAYPRKDGMKGGGATKGEAYKKFRNLPDADQQEALVGVKHYADYVAQPGAPIVAMATTWINQRRWEQFQEPRHVQARDGPQQIANVTQLSAGEGGRF